MDVHCVAIGQTWQSNPWGICPSLGELKAS